MGAEWRVDRTVIRRPSAPILRTDCPNLRIPNDFSSVRDGAPRVRAQRGQRLVPPAEGRSRRYEQAEGKGSSVVERDRLVVRVEEVDLAGGLWCRIAVDT